MTLQSERDACAANFNGLSDKPAVCEATAADKIRVMPRVSASRECPTHRRVDTAMAGIEGLPYVRASPRQRAMPSSHPSTDHDAEPRHPDQDDKGDKKPSPLANPRVRIGLIVGGVVLLVALAVWFTHYWTRGRYRQETNDAYLQADQVAIAPKV